MASRRAYVKRGRSGHRRRAAAAANAEAGAYLASIGQHALLSRAEEVDAAELRGDVLLPVAPGVEIRAGSPVALGPDGVVEVKR